MSETNSTRQDELAMLRARVAELEETLESIRSDQIDAIVIADGNRQKIVTLHGADQAYRTFVEEMGQGAVTLDGDGTILYCNNAFSELLGTSYDRLIAHNIYEFALDEQAAELRTLVWTGMTEHTQLQFTLRGPNGVERKVLITAAPLPIGDVEGVCMVVADMSLHQELHDTKRHNEELAREIEQRRLAEQETRRSSDALRDADRRKNEFIATLAHELRNPLAPVRMAIGLLKKNPNTKDDELVDIIDRQIVQLTRLVDDLVDINRISHGKLKLRRRVVMLADVLNEALSTIRPLAEEKGHKIVCDIPDEAVPLHADPIRMTQVFGNLLNNACKFTERGGLIEVAAITRGDNCVVTIRDNGVGIPTNKLASVFELFAQIDTSVERTQGGLGIGLSLVKRLVELHGGTVDAQSNGTVGGGSQFTVRLPIKTGADNEEIEDPHVAAQPIGTRRVLIVDDNADQARALGLYLRKTGSDTRLASDGAEALEAAETFRPDLVLLDIGLPRLSGYDVCRRIRSQPWGRDITVVALSGWGQEEDRRKSKEAGFSAHLVKPIDFQDLAGFLTR